MAKEAKRSQQEQRVAQYQREGIASKKIWSMKNNEKKERHESN